MDDPKPLPQPLCTVAAFQRDPRNAEQLAEVLQMPVVQRALQALVHAGLPSVTPVRQGFDPLAINAGANQRREGYFEFYGNLLGLTQPAAPAPTAKPKPYEHVKKRNTRRVSVED